MFFPSGFLLKAVILDFDGTLVKSNNIKNEAYYDLFPTIDKKVIYNVVSEANNLSRYEIINNIANSSKGRGIGWDVDELVKRYGGYVNSKVMMCPSTKCAILLLNLLSRECPIYLSSLTPKDSLLEIIKYRGWLKYFDNIFGYPSVKSETLKQIMSEGRYKANEILVIGDGESDKLSTMQVGCHFLQVEQEVGLCECIKILRLDRFNV